MKWSLSLLFGLIVLVLVLFNECEEFRGGRMRMRGSGSSSNKPISPILHIIVAIAILFFYLFNDTDTALTLLILWPIYVAIHTIKILILKSINKESFGTSPGTMVQLRTSHVPTEEDSYYWKYVYPKQVAKEIRTMTESDLR